tara:strand:+ start:1979 stop:2287 length:309 start_codon:yes stop_codon:yes gene_type:complete
MLCRTDITVSIFDLKANGSKKNIDVGLEVKLMFVSAFKFTHVVSELWESGRLVHMESESDDDGSPYKVKVQRQGDGMLVEVNSEKNWRPAIFCRRTYGIGLS